MMQRIYFRETNGYFKWGRLAGQAVQIRGGVYDTDQRVILAAARAALGGTVTAIEDLQRPAPVKIEPNGSMAAPPLPPEPPAFMRCLICGADVRPEEFEMHSRTHEGAPPGLPMVECHWCHEQVLQSEYAEHKKGHGRTKPARRRKEREAA